MVPRAGGGVSRPGGGGVRESRALDKELQTLDKEFRGLHETGTTPPAYVGGIGNSKSSRTRDSDARSGGGDDGI